MADLLRDCLSMLSVKCVTAAMRGHQQPGQAQQAGKTQGLTCQSTSGQQQSSCCLSD